MAEIRKMLILNTVSWKKEGVEKYGISYAKLYDFNGTHAVGLDYKKVKQTSEPYFQAVSSELFKNVQVGDVYTFEYEVGQYDQLIPVLGSCIYNIFDYLD